ncbi:MAG: CpXC domain-containing protein [Bacteroidales bacterium]|nr:CpXC domain-containing protein [Bacteroidales bacterium]
MDNKATYTCPVCGASNTVDIHPLINVSADPELKAKVMDGSLFVWECSSCGRMNLARYTTLYHDPEQKMLILLSDGNPDNEQALVKAFSDAGETDGYTARLVSETGALIEKVKIFEAGLDDRVMEMCKYVTCMEMGSEQALKFFRLDGADGDITLTYPRSGQMEMVNIGFNVYSDCERILRRNPQMTEGSSGLVRIDQDWVKRFFR